MGREETAGDLNAETCLWVQMIFATSPVPSFPTGARLSAAAPSAVAENDGMQPPLRQCQRDCLEACAKGARIIEMACGTGKTRVIKELVSNVSGRVPVAFA